MQKKQKGCSKLLKNRYKYRILANNTPAMPLYGAQIGGFFRMADFINKIAKNVALSETFADTIDNKPAMPLYDAQIGGFFYARRLWA
ncbi:MAG: hypothetical protein O7D86_06455 [Proteobacteria bacterium]|nr:hypothetical protein [Pseudomonadota bacterium]